MALSSEEMIELAKILVCDIAISNTNNSLKGGGIFDKYYKSCPNINPVEAAVELPKGVIVEIADKLDNDTRTRLMFLNRLFMEAFSPSNVQVTKQKRISKILIESWTTLLRVGENRKYIMSFNFEHNGNIINLYLANGFMKISIPSQDNEAIGNLKSVFEIGDNDMFHDDDDDTWGIGIIFGTDPLPYETANKYYTIDHLVNKLANFTKGFKMQAMPSLYKSGEMWLKKVYRSLFNKELKSSKLQPVFEKLSVYLLQATNNSKQNTNNSIKHEENSQIVPSYNYIDRIRISQGPQGILKTSNAQKALEEGTLSDRIDNLRQVTLQKIATDKQTGGSKNRVIYKGHSYVVRIGQRGGKYILVKSKKIYI